MNTHELIESTMLHALGLLDDIEREAYEAAYSAAPAPVRLRVREEARRMADLGDLIPDMAPTPELRSVVLAAVRAAMREDENEARIAAQAAQAAQPQASMPPVIARIDHTTPPPMRATAQPRLSTSPRVHRAWRVATIGFAAACITMGVVMVNINQTVTQAQNRALVDNLYDQIGAKYLESTIFDANTQRVALTSTNTQSKAVAAVWSNPDWNTARLFVKNLASEANKPLRLVVLDDNDEIVRVIETFVPTGEFQDFNVDVNLSTERKLAIYPAIQEAIQQATPVLISTSGTL